MPEEFKSLGADEVVDDNDVEHEREQELEQEPGHEGGNGGLK
jgi:hypothetical protein